ncbi:MULTISPECIES: hypothetical protein [Acinetobacter]|uniref:SMI1/KNR4 family protein n=1 Tax=Acinetobacter piscicola TaxID=2006115 RepID=A0A7S6VVV5_9GAMM|nr:MULTISPECIES: hypothetical protein [Acinetobacter]MDM1756460.1 hypothetical protein [Acinetobacter sp. 256-1]MDM1761586.1 hypothetical protein [Acinetobacter sp. 251-1]QOW45873.1 hypothetical protein G0028_08190 [Acinetobacter piscicola]
MSKIQKLLLNLKMINESDVSNEQILHKVGNNTLKIKTLDGGLRNLSPMLVERFNFVGKWEDAFLLQTWLSLDEINNHQNIEHLVENINLRIENWDFVPPATVGFSKISIFGFDPFDTNETYLEWVAGYEEPRIWVFFDGNYHMFKNLERFLMYTVAELNKDDL